MFDDLRSSDNKNASPFFADDKPLFEDEQEQAAPQTSGGAKPKAARKSGGSMSSGFQWIDSKGRILGMTAVQRFILSALLLAVVCVLGSMFMLVLGAFYI